MNEIGQKNCVLIGTCIIVICFHFAYKFRNNNKVSNILVGIGFTTSLVMTKLLHGWEKDNKVDYNLVLFLYILLDIILFCFLVYRIYTERRLLRGGGAQVDTNSAEYIVGEFKKQDFWVRLLDNPVALKYLNIFKDKVTDNLVHKLNFIKI
jgi:hypothetical protein